MTGGPGTAGTAGVPSRLSRLASVGEYFWVVYRRTWRGSAIGRFVSPVLLLGSLGLGLGSLVDGSSGGVDGVPYLAFVVPALVANQAMWTAMAESTWQVMAYIRWNRMYHAMLATPLAVGDVLMGHLGAVGLHLLASTAIFVVVAALLGGFGSWWALASIPIGVLTGLAFAVPVFAFTATQDDEVGFTLLFRLVMTPLMLFSGTFFPIGVLPLWLQALAWLTPLWHGVELCRGFALGGAGALAPGSGGMVALHLDVLVLYVLAGAVAARITFTRRLAP
jgi:lipooligosaccharide transport system permease protein